MNAVILIFILLCFAEVFFFYFLVRGWKQLPNSNYQQKDNLPRFTLVIPFKNEYMSLPVLLHSLKKQNLDGVEVVFVNDESTDGGQNLIPTDYDIYNNSGKGKKAALHTGISQAKTQWIWQIDADVTLPKDFLQNVRCVLATSSDAKLIGGPVKFTFDRSLFSRLVSIEFASLIGSTLSFMGWKKPIMLNGANLGYQKELWLSFYQSANKDISSGDDVFLAHHTIKEYGENTVQYLKGQEFVIATKGPTSLHSFIQQRIRWAAKSTEYSYVPALVTTWFVGGTQILVLFGIFTGCFWPQILPYVGMFWFFKTILNMGFLTLPLKLLQQKSLLKYGLVLGLVYPFYVVFIGLRSLRGGYFWKGEQIKR